jgi:hypothetical protein
MPVEVKPNSWTFSLEMDSNIIHQNDWQTRLNQMSPLRFETKSDAYEFGRKMFEPQFSVTKWTIISSGDVPNFPFKIAKEVTPK